MGRQRKRKWKRVLPLLAAAAIALIWAWMLCNPAEGKHALSAVRGIILRETSEEWIALPGQADSLASVGDGLVAAGPGIAWAADLEGRTLWRTETEIHAPLVRAWGAYAGIWEPGGGQLLIADRNGCRALPVSSGVDGCAIGPQGQAAVLTSGSGYLTETLIFDPDGALQRSIGLRDSAMAMLLWLDGQTLVSCCVTGEGAWTLRLDGMEESRIFPLEQEIVYDMKPWRQGFALWTSGGIRFYDSGGIPVESMDLPDGTILDWDCGGFAAVLVLQDGKYHIMTAGGGCEWAGDALERRPQMLRVCYNWVCLLDRESLLEYDDRGTLRKSPLGARAAFLEPAGSGLILIGDGRLLYHMLS